MKLNLGLILLTALSFQFFQNCTAVISHGSTGREIQSKGNGDIYSGKTTYELLLDNGVCSDGSNVQARILGELNTYSLTRDNCAELPIAQVLAPADLQFPTATTLIYKAQYFQAAPDTATPDPAPVFSTGVLVCSGANQVPAAQSFADPAMVSVDFSVGYSPLAETGSYTLKPMLPGASSQSGGFSALLDVNAYVNGQLRPDPSGRMDGVQGRIDAYSAEFDTTVLLNINEPISQAMSFPIPVHCWRR